MKFDEATIRLEPLSTSNCIDVSLLFLRRHFQPIAQLVLFFALPSTIAVYWLVYEYAFDVRLPLLLFFVLSSPLGVLLISGTAPAAFGEPFRWQWVLRRNPLRLIRLMVQALLLRAITGVGLLLLMSGVGDTALRVLGGLILCLFPGAWLAVRSGFLIERTVLAELSQQLHQTRGGKLIRKRFSDLLMSGITIAGICGLLWLVMCGTCDVTIDFLFQVPIFLGRIGLDGEIAFLWTGDPKVLALMIFCAFLIYPLGRLAWFFAYIDLRVRRDCWDMELQMLQEAERLEGGQ